jgi:multidrug efflux system membrane fusion protein
MSRWKPESRRGTRVLLPLAALALAALPSCSTKKAKAGPPVETVPVLAAIVETRTVPIEIRAIGHVEALSTVAVKTRVGGEVTQVAFREGQDVKPGDLLFVVDRRPYEAALNEARARLERDRALAKNAEESAARYAELVKKDFVTAQQYDEMMANAAASRATVRADEAALQSVELDLSYCRITAPIGGRTGSLLVNAGNFVKANDDRTLVTINQVRPLYVTFTVPEGSLAAIRGQFHAGGKLAVSAAPSDSRAVENGELSFVDNAVDSATGTIRLKATFPNGSGALWPGQFVNVVLALSTEPNALVIPTQALQSGQEGQYVFVVKSDMTVEARPVTVARTQGPVAVIAKGLAADERVVTDGQLRLAPGSKVEIKSGGEVRS